MQLQNLSRLDDAAAAFSRVAAIFSKVAGPDDWRVGRALRQLSIIQLERRELAAALPNLQLSTDMIVGFPGETDDDFRDTLSLTEAVGYHSMFSFKYSPRPNTLAAQRMPDDVAEAEKTRRIVELQSLQKGIQARLHEASIGRTVDVLVDTTSKRRAWELAGRTSGNTVVNFPGESSWLGTFVPVRIERAGYVPITTTARVEARTRARVAVTLTAERPR
jgi:tRNA-2-methylthio-N6-dimethylallyladenosine synthase